MTPETTSAAEAAEKIALQIVTEFEINTHSTPMSLKAVERIKSIAAPAIEAARQEERVKLLNPTGHKTCDFKDTTADTPSRRAAGTILVALFDEFGIEFGQPFVESAAAVIEAEYQAERTASEQREKQLREAIKTVFERFAELNGQVSLEVWSGNYAAMKALRDAYALIDADPTALKGGENAESD